MSRFVSSLLKPLDSLPSPAQCIGYKARALKGLRRAIVLVLGLSVLAVGIVMIIGPGPAVVVIPLGLGILATEFLWARRLLDALKRRLAEVHEAAIPQSMPPWLRSLWPKLRFLKPTKIDAEEDLAGPTRSGAVPMARSEPSPQPLPAPFSLGSSRTSAPPGKRRDVTS